MIHMIVGNTGSGKTTYSHNLKKELKGIVFSIDKWNKVLFFPDKEKENNLEWILERIERTESIILDLIVQLEHAGIDTILDLGFAKFEHREKFRNFANDRGLRIKIHFLDLSKNERWKRVMQRNEERDKTFEFLVTRADFDFMEEWFEPPSEEEMQNGQILN